MNIPKALASLAEILTTIETVTAYVSTAATTIETVTAHVSTAAELLDTASKENRDLTDAELNQIVARADLSRLSLEAALAG